MHVDLAKLFREFDIPVIEEPGWRTRERDGAFSPVGSMNHHTAAGGTAEAPSLNTVKYGRSGIPGPLCNGLICRKFHLHLISDGRANDSGMGRSDVLRKVRADLDPTGRPTLADDVNGNPWFYDWEFENNGVGEPFAPEMMEIAYRINHALCEAHKWTANRCIAHREWTKRKIDPTGWDMRAFRAEVQRRVDYVAPVPYTPGVTVDPQLKKGDTGHAVRVLQGLLAVHAEDLAMWFSQNNLDNWIDGHFGDNTDYTLREWQRRTQKLAVTGTADQATWDWLKRTQ